MSRNPYAPPDAQVSDPSQAEERPLAERPRTVTIGLWLMWISVVLSVVNVVLYWDTVMSAVGEIPAEMQGFFTAFMVVMMALSFAFYAFVIWKTGQGRNWARIVLLIFQLLSLLSNPFSDAIEGGIPAGALTIVVFVMEVAALVLFFIPASREWFRPRKD